MGHNAERLYAKIMQEAGFTHCKTTRNTSRLLDACKIDLNFLPVLIQIKAGNQKGMNPSTILRQITEELQKNYPPMEDIHKKPRAIIHHKRLEEGTNRRKDTDAIVHMTFNDFLTLMVAYNKQLEYDFQSNTRRD